MPKATSSSKRLRTRSPECAVDDPADEDASSFDISRVPFEVLSEIFAFTETAFRAEQGAGVLTPWTPAYILCRVSKRWRAVALDTPELWTCMTIKGVRSKMRAEAWIEHAKGHPITVLVLLKTRGFADEFLENHASRIEDLCLTFPEPEYKKPRSKVSVAWPAAMLRLVALELQNVPLDDVDDVVALLRTAPRLERLTAYVDPSTEPIQHIFIVPSSTDSVSPSRLTHLQLNTGCSFNDDDVDELCRLLRLCPNLEYLSIDPSSVYNTDFYNGPREPPHVDLPSLRAASMPIHPYTNRLLRRLNTPAMECMVLESNRSCKQLEDGLRDGTLLAQEQVFYQDYEDTYLGIGERDIIYYLSRMPQVEALRLEGDVGNLNRVVRFLATPRDDGTFPLVRLRRLTLESNEGWKISLKGFQKRYEGVESINSVIPPPLEEVEIIDCPIRKSAVCVARGIFEKYGTKFRLINEHMRHEWGYGKDVDDESDNQDADDAEEDDDDDSDCNSDHISEFPESEE